MIPVRGVDCLEEQSVLHSISSRTNPQRKAELNGTLKRSIGKDGGVGKEWYSEFGEMLRSQG